MSMAARAEQRRAKTTKPLTIVERPIGMVPRNIEPTGSWNTRAASSKWITQRAA